MCGMKQFDRWNKLKKKVNEKQPEFFVNEREVRYAHVGLNVGYEEDGKGVDFKRPVLVLKKIGHMFVVLPMTTKGKDTRFYYRLADSYFNKPSRVILSQLKVIDKARFIKDLAIITEEDFQNIKEKLKALLL